MPLCLALAAASAACTCKATQSSLLGPDGGPVSCVVADDCPRTGTDNVCVTNSPADYSGTCVSCQAYLCARVVTQCP
jgi:hypothetical protein